MNAENEAALDAGNEEGREKLTDNKETVQHSSQKCNGIASPPAGHAWENGELVPVVLPPTEGNEIEAERLEFYRRFAVLLNWAMEQEVSPKLAAMWKVLGRDQRSLRAIAEDIGCSKRLIEIRVAEAKEILCRAGRQEKNSETRQGGAV